jgi:hypothetical protein
MYHPSSLRDATWPQKLPSLPVLVFLIAPHSNSREFGGEGRGADALTTSSTLRLCRPTRRAVTQTNSTPFAQGFRKLPRS